MKKGEASHETSASTILLFKLLCVDNCFFFSCKCSILFNLFSRKIGYILSYIFNEQFRSVLLGEHEWYRNVPRTTELFLRNHVIFKMVAFIFTVCIMENKYVDEVVEWMLSKGISKDNSDVFKGNI